MKKIVLSIAGVLAVAAFAPEASALPVFARQTGMACSACHFQHFPMLNAFGRSFKSGAFTMMGAQTKVEEEGSLSIPATLNMAVLTSFGYIKSNQTADPSGVTKNYGNGVWGVPGVGAGGSGEASLFVGGRVSDFAGFLTEITLGGPSVQLSSAKLPVLFAVGDYRVGFVPFATNGQGASYTLETLNTGANAIHMQSNTVGPNGEFAGAMSAQQYIGTATAATGMGFVGTSDMGFVNLTKFQQTGTTGGTYASWGSTYARVVGTFDLAGWDSAVGIQSWSGSSAYVNPNAQVAVAAGTGLNMFGGAAATGAGAATAGVMQTTKASAIDGQMQGELAGMPVGFYASYARSPASPYTAGVAGAAIAGQTNTFNGGSLTRSSFNLSAELGVLPGVATIGAAIRRASSGVDGGLASVANTANGNNLKDNAYFLTATYKLQQNMLARLSYVKQSGSYWDARNAPATAPTNSSVLGSQTTMLNMYVLF
jgi:hypothetical protein